MTHPLVLALAVLGVDAQPVGHAFRSGPYSAIAVDPTRPERVLVATEDGHVLWSSDGGRTATDSIAISPRRLDPMALRGTGVRGALSGAAVPLARSTAQRSTRLFTWLARQGLPTVRWASWMAIREPDTRIADLAFRSGSSGILAAGGRGALVSDESRTAFTLVLGPEVVPLAVGSDPRDSRRLLAGTGRGLYVSRDGGATFVPHPSRVVAEVPITQLVWDPLDPRALFAVSGDSVLMSQDGGATFAPGLSAQGTIRALTLTPEAAYVATSQGLLVATGDQLHPRLGGKDVLGAVGWSGGRALAVTATELLLVEPDGTANVLRRTTERDPYLRLVGAPGQAWLLSRHGVLRLTATRPRETASPAGAPRLAVAPERLEALVLAHTGLGSPLDTRLHDRWYARLLPRLVVQVDGVLAEERQRVRDGLFPIGERQVTSGSDARTAYGVFATWDLSRAVFGDESNASNPNLQLERSLRENRERILREAHRRYAECAELVRRLAAPPADPREELSLRTRLEEHASYLAFLAGREVIRMEASP